MPGCKTSVNSVENAQKTGQRQMISDQRAITDTGLGKKVSIVGVNSAITPGGFLKVQIELLNTTRSPSVSAINLNGSTPTACSSTALTTAEIPDQIEGGEDKFISGLAPTPACQGFSRQVH